MSGGGGGLAGGELLAQGGGGGGEGAHLQEFGHDGVVGDGHEGGARAGDPERPRSAGKARGADCVVVGDEGAAVGFLQAVVVRIGDEGEVAGLEAARHARDAAHLPHRAGERNLLRDDLARLARVHLVGRDHGDKAQAVAHVVAQAAGQSALGRERAHGAAQNGGGDVVGVPLDGGGDAHELGAVDRMSRERCRRHDARDNARRAAPQATRDRNIGVDVELDGEGLLAPFAQRVDERDVYEVRFVLELLGAARDLELIGALESEVRVQRDRHAECVVADAEIGARGRNGDLDHEVLLGARLGLCLMFRWGSPERRAGLLLPMCTGRGSKGPRRLKGSGGILHVGGHTVDVYNVGVEHGLALERGELLGGSGVGGLGKHVHAGKVARRAEEPQGARHGAGELVRARGGQQHTGLGAGRGGLIRQDVVAAGGVRVDEVAVRLPARLDGRRHLILVRPTAAKDLLDLGEELGRDLIRALGELVHELGDEFAIAIAQVVQHALEVGRDEDVHARRGSGEERSVAVIGTGGEEVVEHVVLVAGNHELGHGQPQALGIVAGEDVAKVAGGHAELHGVAGLDGAGAQQLRVGGKVVHHLRDQAAHVDGVGAGESHALRGETLGELAVGEDALDRALGVVKIAAHPQTDTLPPSCVLICSSCTRETLPSG